jgi:hypothetical protein
LFIATGAVHTERTGLTLQACAGQAAMARMAVDIPKLKSRIGEVRFLCIEVPNG